MSVLIKGVKLPKSCFGCHLFKLDDTDLWCIANHYAGCCRALSKYIDENKFVNERHPDCPLIEVPTPHGRLIDADAVNRKMDERIETLKDDASIYEASCVAVALEMFAPTVIEAED